MQARAQRQAPPPAFEDDGFEETAPVRRAPARQRPRVAEGSMGYEEPAPRRAAPRAPTRKQAAPAVQRQQRFIEVDEETGEEIEYIRVPARASNREGHRDPVRQMGRRARAEVVGRGGERLTRKRISTIDPFNITPDMKEPGWDLQWIAHSVTGNTDVVADQNLAMTENGWRPVMADRFPGRFMPQGYKGHIVRGGQGLYERPEQLSAEARAEEVQAARQLISDRNEALQLTSMRKNMRDGFEMSRKYRGTGGNVNIQMDRNVDMPKPSYQLADD